MIGFSVGILDKRKDLKNRVGDEKNAICLRGFNTPVKTNKSYSIPLSVNSCYEITNISSALRPKTVFIVAFSFKLVTAIKDEMSYYIFFKYEQHEGCNVAERLARYCRLCSR